MSLAKELPEVGERGQFRIVAVIVPPSCRRRRGCGMREELACPGTESGPVVAWVIDTIIRELLPAGNAPAAT